MLCGRAFDTLLQCFLAEHLLFDDMFSLMRCSKIFASHSGLVNAQLLLEALRMKLANTMFSNHAKASLLGLPLLRKIGCSAEQLKDAGCSARHLRAVGFSIRDLSYAGYTPSDLQLAVKLVRKASSPRVGTPLSIGSKSRVCSNCGRHMLPHYLLGRKRIRILAVANHKRYFGIVRRQSQKKSLTFKE